MNIFDSFNGRVNRNADSIMFRIYDQLVKKGHLYSPVEKADHIGIVHTKINKITRSVFIDCADIEEFMTNDDIRLLFAKGLIKRIISRYDGIVNAIHIPWASPDFTQRDKDIDIAFICSITSSWLYHKTREQIRDILMTLQLKTNLRIIIGTFFDDLYQDIIERSKIVIVEGSGRKLLTTKYLCAGSAGCLLLGDIPANPGYSAELFKDCMIGVDDWTQLPDIIAENFNEKRKQILCRDMIREKFNINKIVNLYEQAWNV